MQCRNFEVVTFWNVFLRRIRQTRGVMNQFRLQRERKEHIRKMLMSHMPYVYNAYKLEEVETVRIVEEGDI